MFDRDPKSIAEARTQAHWASQLLSASADALLERADDDSHSNLAYASGVMTARTEVALHLDGLALQTGDQTFEFSGQTMHSAVSWLSEKLGKPVSLRDYDMPAHAVTQGKPFDTSDVEAFKGLVEWLDFAHKLMQPIAPCRLWPHHFDLGWLITQENGKQIGGGFSLGDEHFPEPYFYVNPYGADRPKSLPVLPAGGFWTESWFGAVQTAEAILGHDEPMANAKSFLDAALTHCRELISG